MSDFQYTPKGDALVIVGMGPTCQYLRHFYGPGLQRNSDATDIWAINNAGWWFHDIDMIISMDDPGRDQRFEPKYVVGLEGRSLGSGVPLLTCTETSGMAQWMPYPLREVCQTIGAHTGYRYLQNSLNYAFALGIHLGFKRITLLGCEWTNPDPEDLGERDEDWPQDGEGKPYLTPDDWPYWAKYCSRRALKARYAGEPGEWCMAFLYGIAVQRGILVRYPHDTTLFDQDRPQFFYGFQDQPTDGPWNEQWEAWKDAKGDDLYRKIEGDFGPPVNLDTGEIVVTVDDDENTPV